MFDELFYFQIFILTVVNILILIFRRSIYSWINIEDNPDGILKIHKQKIYSIGGVFFFVNIIIYFLLERIFNVNLNYIYRSDVIDEIIFIFSLSCMFLIGLYDDKFLINYKLKFFLLSIIIILSIFFDQNLIISNVQFTFSNRIIDLGIFSIPITILCILLFINALNLFDGIDLQSGFYILTLSLYFLFELKQFFFISIFVASIFFLYLNYKKEIFLGDNGTILIGFLISYFCIKASQQGSLKSDEIFIMMMIPGLDMFRLFIIRLMNQKNPFKGDRNHIHHILIDKYGFTKTLIIIQLLIFFPLILLSTNKISSIIIIFFILLIYCYLIFYKKKI